MSGLTEARLVLADGTTFEGEAIGATPPDATGQGGWIATGEVVFNTVLTGYQEVLTDPSYAGQIITFTYPHIGNYGVTSADDESARPFCRGVVIRDLARRHSNWRSQTDLDSFLRDHGVPGIAGIDTRRLTRHLRDAGAMPGAFGTADAAALEAAARAEPGTDGVDLARVVTCAEPYTVGDGPRRVVAYDFGIKRAILAQLGRIATVEVVPATTTAADVLARRPDGVFLSNGPGDPAAVDYAVESIRGLLGEVPVFGICLGHQLMATALGARTYKLRVRPSRRQPPGASPGHGSSRDHQPEPQLLGARRARFDRGHPPQPQRRHGRGPALARGAGLQRAAPSRSRAGTARRPVPVRSVRRAHGRSSRRAPRGTQLMPRRDDISSILLIGSGPIVIGQACEFDYSGTQACRVLRDEGYRVILANSNPATIMTDPDFADATYVEPLDADVLTKIIEREHPDALLPTLGGQTALNLAMELVERGVLEREGVELIGANAEAIATAEDRERFKVAMGEIGLDTPASAIAHTLDEAMSVVDQIGLPVVIRPAYILGGRGTGIAATTDEFARAAEIGLEASPISEILIEESIAGWKEFELEVMRDRADNCVVICSIENLDPMGVHTGDSVTVAPAQTLSDVEYQRMRDAAFACIRRVGVETGGSNVQFALNPVNGDMVIIEMNPRVSRSSALASKATGFPIAKIAARLAVGYRLDEIDNDITHKTPASFEPVIDYVVTKIPRWAFEKFPGIPAVLGTQMQSVGEAMAIGRTFPESLQKGLRSLEHGRLGLNCDPGERLYDELTDAELVSQAAIATPDRPYQLEAALRRGIPVDDLYAATRVDPWFLDQILAIVEERQHLAELWAGSGLGAMTTAGWKRAKRLGFSDAQLAWLHNQVRDDQVTELDVRAARVAAGVRPTFKTVDTCAAEFEADTPYHYSTWEDEDEVRPSDRPKVVILGSGPNRIGQGIEFDYCCVHASFALRDAGFETIMVNCNPETVSTDYDTSDRLYFEPLTYEDVMHVIEAEQPMGVVVALGGQTPLKLAGQLPPGLVLGTSPESIDLAEDRERWNALCARLEIPQPAGGTATEVAEAMAVVERVGYPVLMRPSYVLGGRAMEIVYDDDGLKRAMAELAGFGSLGKEGGLSADRPVLVDRFLEDAIEVDVDAIRDATGETIIGGIMEHVEEAGVHSGDSACVLPPPHLSAETIAVIEGHTRRIADELDVRGLINVQYAVKENQVFVIEANPRASRTVPFVAKATGVPLAKVAARVMTGSTLEQLRDEGLLVPGVVGDHVAVKEAVLPFSRFPDADAVLGPEMRSTGEVMGIDLTVGLAFVKSQLAAGNRLPESGTVFLSLADRDKAAGVRAAEQFVALGFDIAATSGTAAYLTERGVPVATVVTKLGEQGGNDAVELIASGQVQLVVNSPRGRGPRADGAHIRAAAGGHRVPLLTTVAAGLAAANGMADWARHPLRVRTLQEYQRGIRDDQLQLEL